MTITGIIGGIDTYGSLGLLSAIVDSDAPTIEAALEELLTTDTAVSEIVGVRVYPNLRKGQPSIVYKLISAPRDHVMLGPTGLVRSRFQLNCWAGSHVEAKALFEAVRLLLDGYSGTIGNMVISSVELANEGDIPQFKAGVEELTLYGKRLDAIIWFKEGLV